MLLQVISSKNGAKDSVHGYSDGITLQRSNSIHLAPIGSQCSYAFLSKHVCKPKSKHIAYM
jgi:hypothetical protein